VLLTVSTGGSEERQLIEAVAAGIAHEVRNPLNAMQLHVEILEQELAALVPNRDAHVYTVLTKLANELRNLDSFVSEFLRFARPPHLNLESVSIRALVTDLATFITPECAKKGVDLSLNLDRGPTTVLADGFQLKHALLNLVLNGLQATPAGGRITIDTDGDDERLIIRISDSGEGIPQGMEDHIFEIFFTTREGGTGLGLPIARRIVEGHKGTLTISSAPGTGAVATIILPARARR
jgi:signal transduction histidine kinase